MCEGGRVGGGGVGSSNNLAKALAMLPYFAAIVEESARLATKVSRQSQ